MENGFQYIAYRRLASETAQYGGYSGYGWYGGYQRFYRVLVKGIDDPKNAPENFNVAAVPSQPHLELTPVGWGFTISGIIIVPSLLLLILLPVL